jgi:hypothetical protein
MKHDVAKQIVSTMHKVTMELDAAISFVQRECTEEEFVAFRRAAGRAMGYLFTDIVRPIFKDYPDLIPEEMKKGTDGE